MELLSYNVTKRYIQCLFEYIISRSASQPVSQSASQPVSQSASQPVSQSASRVYKKVYNNKNDHYK